MKVIVCGAGQVGYNIGRYLAVAGNEVTVIDQRQEVLQIPTSALFRQDGQWEVFIIENDKARQVPVTTGQTNGLVTEILSGLELTGCG